MVKKLYIFNQKQVLKSGTFIIFFKSTACNSATKSLISWNSFELHIFKSNWLEINSVCNLFNDFFIIKENKETEICSINSSGPLSVSFIISNKFKAFILTIFLFVSFSFFKSSIIFSPSVIPS